MDDLSTHNLNQTNELGRDIRYGFDVCMKNFVEYLEFFEMFIYNSVYVISISR